MQIKNKVFFILLNIFSIIFLNINVNAEEFNISAQEITIDKVNNIGAKAILEAGGKLILMGTLVGVSMVIFAGAVWLVSKIV